MEEEYMLDILFHKDSVNRVTVRANVADRLCRSKHLVVGPFAESGKVVRIDNPITPVSGQLQAFRQNRNVGIVEWHTQTDPERQSTVPPVTVCQE
jgi:hypothetical protein